jgi:enhancing lycopene biosynthesis protein 2
MKKYAVLLSGCGGLDGSEIHEATLALLAISKVGSYTCFAPNINQHEVINHFTKQVMTEKRNVMIESARIAKGTLKPLEQYNPTNFDGLILPGGYGTIKNLCTFHYDGAHCSIDPLVQKAILETHAAKKWIGGICAAPMLIARAFYQTPHHIKITIGSIPESEAILVSWGAQPQSCTVYDVCIDEQNHIVSTPAYILAENILDVHMGIEKLVAKMTA